MEGFLPATTAGGEIMAAADPSLAAWIEIVGSSNFYPTAKAEWADVKQGVIDVLQQALDMTLPRFPAYKVAMRTGLFWRYLEPNHRPGPFVRPDIVNPCMPMHLRSNNRLDRQPGRYRRELLFGGSARNVHNIYPFGSAYCRKTAIFAKQKSIDATENDT